MSTWEYIKSDPKRHKAYKERHAHLKRLRRLKDLDKFREYEREYNRTHAKKKRSTFKCKAGSIVRNAVVAGKIKKPKTCPSCGDKKCKIEGHHADYFRPLSIEWLCTMCHGKKHRKYPAIGEKHDK